MLRLMLIAVLACQSVAHAQDRPAKPEAELKRKSQRLLDRDIVVERDLAFAETEDGPLKLDVYRPANAKGPTPTIVFVHGGGWKNGDKKSAEKTAAWIVPDGYAVVSVNYRLTDVAQWPAQIDDCYAAIRWVRTNAAKYNFDPDNIAAWGTSAGGHLAALIGTRPYPGDEVVSSRVQAVCDWFGPTDLLTMPPNMVSQKRTFEQVAQSNGAKLLGAPVPTIPEIASDASALHNVTADDAPTLIMHGSEDPGVPLAQSERFAAALKAAGVPHELHIVDGAGHGGPLFQNDKSRNIVRQFFDSHLKK